MKKSELRKIVKEELNIIISEGAYEDAMDKFTNLVKKNLEDDDSLNKEYTVEYLYYKNDDYLDDTIKVKASSEKEALKKAETELKKSGPRAIRFDKLRIV
jgi:hypothetical protein